jgi:oxalate decarboxylase
VAAAAPGKCSVRPKALNPNSFTPPPTDHGLPQMFWSSFSMMHRRVQDGGWSRQVNVHDFPISTEIAGVNMRLTAGGIRELHWLKVDRARGRSVEEHRHATRGRPRSGRPQTSIRRSSTRSHKSDEWALMLNGNCRLAGQELGRGKRCAGMVLSGSSVPHSLQGLGPDGCEFLLVFDDGRFSEDDTTLLSDWMIHTPPEVTPATSATSRRRWDITSRIPATAISCFWKCSRRLVTRTSRSTTG